MQTNPLLVTEGFPRFDLIEPEHVVLAVKQILDRAEHALQEIEQRHSPTWAGLIQPLEKLDIPFEYGWSPVQHLHGVKNSPELREAYEHARGDVVQFSLRVRQSVPIYETLKAMREGAEWNNLDEAQRRIVTDRLHGHILALLLGIRHIILDNDYGKVAAYHAAWTAGSPLVRQAATAEEALAGLMA